MMTRQAITPCLWLDGRAEEAAEFYVSLFPESRIDDVVKSPLETPGASTGSALLVEFTLAGQRYWALNGGPHEPFNDAISLAVTCRDQTEVDRLWDALTADGGKPVQCGWLKDKFGVSWQIVPEAMADMIKDRDREKAGRALEAMLGMTKIDIAILQAAYDGR
ncbi:MAG: VOC family protein [Rhodospirillales bacterium]